MKDLVEPLGRQSIAFLVDDLATWLAAGRQPTGIQRVETDLLQTAWARTDVDAWAALVAGAPGGADDIRLWMVDREAMTWGARPDPRVRALEAARRVIRSLPIPHRPRQAAKAIYLGLSLRIGHFHPSEVRLDSAPDLLVVAGGFWAGDIARRIAGLAMEGPPLRIVAYDLLPITHPEWFKAELRREFQEAFDILVPLADRIVTLSRHVADDVARLYPVAAERVRVAQPGLAAHAPKLVGSPHPEHHGVPGPFLLALSTVEPRKNHRVILDAWRAARTDPRMSDAWLVVAGGQGWLADDIEAEIARDAGRLNIRRLSGLGDAEIDHLYAACRATVHASWDEGFGLPARESIVRGIPTLLSTGIPRDGLPPGSCDEFDPSDAVGLSVLMTKYLVQPPVRRAVDLHGQLGWEPVLSALID